MNNHHEKLTLLPNCLTIYRYGYGKTWTVSLLLHQQQQQTHISHRLLWIWAWICKHRDTFRNSYCTVTAVHTLKGAIEVKVLKLNRKVCSTGESKLCTEKSDLQLQKSGSRCFDWSAETPFCAGRWSSPPGAGVPRGPLVSFTAFCPFLQQMLKGKSSSDCGQAPADGDQHLTP